MLNPFSMLGKSLQIMLIVNLAIFLLCFLGKLAHFPVEDLLIFARPEFLEGLQLWRVVTYMFTHTDPIHFLFNMLMLWMFGAEVAEIMGDRKFTLFYLGAGLFAMLASMYWHPYVLGASGALYAVMFAYAHYYPERQILIFFLFPMPMKYAIYVFAVLDLMLVSGGSSITVAHLTHIGGFVAAFLYFRFFEKRMFAGPSAMERWLASVQRPTPSKSKVHEVDFAVPSKEPEPVVQHLVAEDRLDEILAKVSKDGLASLTEEEKDYLLQASKTRQIRSGKAKENE